ncbi:LAFE_0D11738g1_1 [Lachancea fermentati]|uniref:LAFE_0D11738g1_1 n=1 Tax=Lachancea fermentati TaxID=4955 RepID=A0A1G4MC26_LACFM|nr:LAFE_0D11738g1_1 [Lachancea fermentati]
MSFQNQYALATARNQINPQQLTNNVFFGPLNTLSQLEFISLHNIRFFISVGISTKRAAQYFRSISVDEFVMVTFDETLDSNVAANSDDILSYEAENSLLLKQLIAKVQAETPEPVTGRCLTPQPDVNQLLYQNVNTYTSNVVSARGVQKYESFNDMLTLFRLSHSGNVLVFSDNGNDEELVTMLISHILKENTSVSLMEAFQYVKSIRPTVSELKQEQIFWCNGLIDYSERVKAREMFWGPGTQAGFAPWVGSLSTKRRNCSSLEDEEEHFRSRSGSPLSMDRAIASPKTRKIAMQHGTR